MAQSVAVRAPIPVGDHGSDSSISSATSIDVPANAGYVIIQALTQNVRIRLDGGTATTSSGFQVAAGECLMFPVTPGSAISIIEETASASAQWQFLSN